MREAVGHQRRFKRNDRASRVSASDTDGATTSISRIPHGRASFVNFMIATPLPMPHRNPSADPTISRAHVDTNLRAASGFGTMPRCDYRVRH